MKLMVISSHAQANEWLTRHVEVAWPQCEYRVMRAERLFEPQPLAADGADVVVVILWASLPGVSEARELQALKSLAHADGARPVVVMTGPRSKRFTDSVWQTGVAAHLELGSVTREAVQAAVRAAARQLEIQSASMTRAPAPPPKPIPFQHTFAPAGVLATKPERSTTLMRDASGDHAVFKTLVWGAPVRDGDPVYARMRDAADRYGTVSHPALERVRGVWREETSVVVATEYLQGGTLGARRVAGIEVEDALRWFVMLADGLTVLHRAGLAHGDVRASNVVFRDRHQPVWVDYAALSPVDCRGMQSKTQDASVSRDLVRLGWVLRDLLVFDDLAVSESPPGFVAPLPAKHRWLEPVFRGLIRAPGTDGFLDAAQAIAVLESHGARHNRDVHFAQLANLQWPKPVKGSAGR
jgi:serine/threonine protein kinase